MLDGIYLKRILEPTFLVASITKAILIGALDITAATSVGIYIAYTYIFFFGGGDVLVVSLRRGSASVRLSDIAGIRELNLTS